MPTTSKSCILDAAVVVHESCYTRLDLPPNQPAGFYVRKAKEDLAPRVSDALLKPVDASNLLTIKTFSSDTGMGQLFMLQGQTEPTSPNAEGIPDYVEEEPKSLGALQVACEIRFAAVEEQLAAAKKQRISDQEIAREARDSDKAMAQKARDSDKATAQKARDSDKLIAQKAREDDRKQLKDNFAESETRWKKEVASLAANHARRIQELDDEVAEWKRKYQQLEVSLSIIGTQAEDEFRNIGDEELADRIRRRNLLDWAQTLLAVVLGIREDLTYFLGFHNALGPSLFLEERRKTLVDLMKESN